MIKRVAFFIALLLCFVQAFAQLDQKLTQSSRVNLTVSNIGMIGNSFRGVYNTLNYPSCQFPGRSRIEHLFNGGLWVGGLRGPSRQLLVTTGASASSAGYSPGSSNYEFQPIFGDRITERSSKKNKGALYNPRSVSHQDYLATFFDTSRFATTDSRNSQILIPNHTPLGLKVEMESYNWDFQFSNFFVILQYKITNINTDPSDYIDSVYVGMWTDPVIRNVSITQPGGTPFFSAGGSGYIDSLKLGYEFDANGDTAFTRSYFGMKFLGGEDRLGFRYDNSRSSLPINQNFGVFYNTWNFNVPDPLYFGPSSEQERFGRLSSGLNKRPDWLTTITPTIRQPFNRSMFVSAGPFVRLNPGESVTVSFAVICAKTFEDGRPIGADTKLQKTNLERYSRLVQNAYMGGDRDYDGRDDETGLPPRRYLLPEPPEIPNTRVIAKDKSIEVYWAENSEFSIDPITKTRDFAGYRLYLSKFGFDTEPVINLDSSMRLLVQWDKIGDKTGVETGFDAIRLSSPVRFDGDTNEYWYKYTIDNVPNGWQHVVAVTGYDLGDPINGVESQESAISSNLFQAFPGKTANKDISKNEPYAYPNPYYGEAAWEGRASVRPEDRRLMFANLPAKCLVKVFTASGDLVDQFRHESTTAPTSDAWFRAFSDPSKPYEFSGGEHPWDLLSQNAQIIAPGLYQFSVEDLESGKTTVGKFVIIK